MRFKEKETGNACQRTGLESKKGRENGERSRKGRTAGQGREEESKRGYGMRDVGLPGTRE